MRWAYAIQCSDADAVLEKLAALATDGPLGAQEVQELLADLPIDRVLAGAGEIQSVARHDAGLRRALRAARESMRGEETSDGPQKISPDRDKGAV